MKSFKNSYIRNNNLVELQNTSFESPLITTNSYLYYNSNTLIARWKWIKKTQTEILFTITDPCGSIQFLPPVHLKSSFCVCQNGFVNYDNK